MWCDILIQYVTIFNAQKILENGVFRLLFVAQSSKMDSNRVLHAVYHLHNFARWRRKKERREVTTIDMRGRRCLHKNNVQIN